MTQADRLYADPALARFYDLDNGWAADAEFCARLAAGAASVLDIGCGTGLLLASLDNPRRVGVDPAGAMLDIARARPGGNAVQWVQADARGLDLDERFDLVVLTGHAFQVFLTADDQRAALAAIARHLAPGGRFAFDSRNPAAAEWRQWTPEAARWTIADPELGLVEAWNDAAHDVATGIVTYGTHYRTGTGRTWSARSRIRFTAREDLATVIAAAGLAVDRWLGGWDGRPWAADAADIIPLGRLQKDPTPCA